MPPNHTDQPRGGRRDALLAALAIALVPRLVQAQTAPATQPWPDRPVRLIVPFGAGGAVDTLSRLVAQPFAEVARGQSLVVENRAGAGGTIAGAAVAQSRPDGTTLMMADLGANAIAQELMRGLPYDPLKAFQPICHLVTLPLALVVPAGSPDRDAAGLLARAKARPDLLYAHPGIGYVGHLAQELMLREAGVRMTPVPYRSGAEVVRSLLQNETESAIITVSTSGPFIREGKLRAIAVCGREPVAALPGVPTLAATLPGFEASVWHGIVGPAGLPPEMVAAANRVFNAIIARPEVQRAVEQTQAGVTVGGSPEAFATLIQAEVARWAPLIRSLGLRAE